MWLIIRKFKESRLRKKGELSVHTKTIGDDIFMYCLKHKDSDIVTFYDSNFKVIVEDSNLNLVDYSEHGDGYIALRQDLDEELNGMKLCNFFLYAASGIKLIKIPKVIKSSVFLCPDLSYGRAIRTFYGPVYHMKKDNGKYLVYNNGRFISEVYDYKLINDKFIIKHMDGSEEVMSDEVTVKSDYTKVLSLYKHPNDTCVFIGKRGDNGIVFNFMSFTGRVNSDIEFTRYYLFDEYILVSRVDEKAMKEGIKYSFLSIYNGDCFDVLNNHVLSFSDVVEDRVFVELHSKDDDDYGTVLLLDLTMENDSCIIKELKRVAENYVELEFGTFNQYLALVVNKDGKSCYIDLEGNEFPLSGKEVIKPNQDACSIGYWDLKNIYTVEYKEYYDEDYD